jgi:hypothetical protein
VVCEKARRSGIEYLVVTTQSPRLVAASPEGDEGQDGGASLFAAHRLVPGVGEERRLGLAADEIRRGVFDGAGDVGLEGARYRGLLRRSRRRLQLCNLCLRFLDLLRQSKLLRRIGDDGFLLMGPRSAISQASSRSLRALSGLVRCLRDSAAGRW